MRAHTIREKFSTYFQNLGHQKVASSSLIPHNDPTLLFANAGMNQFKDYFTGKAHPKFSRATTIQKCVRAGGKHNDLENVGHTARHHTFFEMLGNFSFGDYFKEQAIAFAWQFLTKEIELPADRLYVTVHHQDEEARKLWQKVGVSNDRIFNRGDKDNFWEMGQYGPCGPCSEIYYDHGEKYASGVKGIDFIDDESRFVEIWNLVFMQFEKSAAGTAPLPRPSIDTGAGLERIAAIKQGKYWNYDTDLFLPLIHQLESITHKSYQDEKFTSAIRVVSDHIRSCTMLITDGVIPSNEGRGYVLRRIIRRAVHYLQKLEAPAGSFAKLVPTVFEILGAEYPQNAQNQTLAEKFLQLEESKFLETLGLGLDFLRHELKKLNDKVLPGEVAFKLYDTYGLPLDLTENIMRDEGYTIGEGFEAAMQKQKEQSKKSWKNATGTDLKVFYDAVEKFGPSEFLGYEQEAADATLLTKIPLGENTALVFNQTPFYGESGGQLGDTGEIGQDNFVLAHIENTLKPIPNLIVHLSKDADGLVVGQKYHLNIDHQRRQLTRANHSATHLLQAALRQVLGTHVNQAGSSVGPDKLRFDFTHHQAVTKEELQRVAQIVNEQIQNDLPVTAKIMDKEEALKTGAQALFGEKYGAKVRVMEMGDFSKEFCGGTHVSHTGEIELFIILSESSLASGIRRIEAVTRQAAFNFLLARHGQLSALENQFNLKASRLAEHFGRLQDELKQTQKLLAEQKTKLMAAASNDLAKTKQTLPSGLTFWPIKVDAGEDLKKLSDVLANQMTESGLMVLYQQKEASAPMANILLKAIHQDKLDCAQLLKTSLQGHQGKGGGRAPLAQGSIAAGEISAWLEQLRKMI